MSKSGQNINILINGNQLDVSSQATVAAALAQFGAIAIRRSRTGEPRGALCGMGICHECRATINGQLHQRTCQLMCQDGMRIETDV